VVACEDEDGNDLDVPLVSIYFRWKFSIYPFNELGSWL
jgi:hypothetical protein